MESMETLQEQKELSTVPVSSKASGPSTAPSPPINQGGKLTPQNGNTREKKLARTAAGFFALMIVLTFVSRAADSMTVPIVTTKSPRSASLEHDISLSGTVHPNKERAVVTDAGILIKDVPVREGQVVKAGDTLLILDQANLKEKITDISLELQKLQLQVGNTEEKKQQSTADTEYSIEKAQNDLLRAEEDLDRVIEEADSAIKRAREDLDDTLEKWANAGQDHLSEMQYGERDEDYEYEKENFVNPYETEYRASRRTLQDMRNKKDTDILAAERVIEDKKQAVEDAKRKLDVPEEVSVIDIDIQQKNREIAKFSKYQNAGGVVTSQIDGVITEIKVKSGQRTTGETIISMAEEASGFRFEAEVDEEQMKYVTLGDEVKINFPGNKEPTTAKIDNIDVKTDDEGILKSQIIIELPPEAGNIGLGGTIEISKKTDNYPMCIPINAVREDNAEKYVLVVEERESVLGVEMVAVRVPIQVLDKDSVNAAVEGMLYRDSKIIVSSEKQISEGDRVRLGV